MPVMPQCTRSLTINNGQAWAVAFVRAWQLCVGVSVIPRAGYSSQHLGRRFFFEALEGAATDVAGKESSACLLTAYVPLGVVCSSVCGAKTYVWLAQCLHFQSDVHCKLLFSVCALTVQWYKYCIVFFVQNMSVAQALHLCSTSTTLIVVCTSQMHWSVTSAVAISSVIQVTDHSLADLV